MNDDEGRRNSSTVAATKKIRAAATVNIIKKGSFRGLSDLHSGALQMFISIWIRGDTFCLRENFAKWAVFLFYSRNNNIRVLFKRS